MFQVERLQKIRQIIREQKSIDVLWLSTYLKVSEVTIRRDLEKLENEGILKRTYGGAILNESVGDQYSSKSNEENVIEYQISKENRILGELSSSIVENYDIVFLDKCPSNFVLADALSTRTGVVVVTNSLDILDIMKKHKTNQVILTGGSVDYNNNTMSNSENGISFPDIRINKAFTHVKAVDLETGLAMNDNSDAYLYNELKKRSKSMVAIMERSVFDKVGLIKVDDIGGIDYVIASEGIPDSYKKIFYQNGVELHQKFEL